MVWKQFGERVQARRHKQAAVDQEEEQLRLNRVSESDISRILTYLGM